MSVVSPQTQAPIAVPAAPPAPAPARAVEGLGPLFLVSGFAALIYQNVWQRVLFTAFGVNIESVTIIVSVFMFGLGIGSLAGGVLSRRFPRALPELFLLSEVLIGAFGLVSLPLMKATAQFTLHSSLLTLSLTTFALLCVPTILMGATLPVLVSHMHRSGQNVGQSVARLYFLNTLGSAIACFLTADLLFVFAGQQTAVLVAALCNFAVGLLVYRYTKRQPARAAEPEEPVVGPPLSAQERRGQLVRFGLVLLLSALVGYVALSQEILWFRLVSYTTGSRPDAFAHVLGFMLIGVAYGARDTKKVAEKERGATLTFIAVMLTLAGVIYYAAVPLVAELSAVAGKLGLGAAFAAVLVVAFLVGSIFPALCHYGIETQRDVGLPLAWVYFANIVGATAGPLLTGFVLLEFYTLQDTILAVSLLTLALAAGVWLFAPVARPVRLAAAAALMLGMVVLTAIHGSVYANVLEKLHFQEEFAQKGTYQTTLQNRSGIIAVEADAVGTVYGGGAFDGTFNVDPVRDSNGIRRAYMALALHPDPRAVLEIGLSSGSWARVVVGHPAVQSFTSVEINPAYHALIAGRPEAAPLLANPKVTLYFDDGRRWLERHPDRKFDFILMNTPQHWRDHVANLLSVEFLRLCRDHLKEGGVIYYNATESRDVPYTAAQVFRHVTMYGSFVAASDRPFAMTPEDKRRNLAQFRQAGKPVFAADDPAAQAVLTELANSDTSDLAPRLRARTDCWVITDDNMVPEFKRRLSRFAIPPVRPEPATAP